MKDKLERPKMIEKCHNGGYGKVWFDRAMSQGLAEMIQCKCLSR